MNKLTKIGASALAGSLMTLSANALEVSMSGGASVGIYQSNQTNGSAYFMNDNINFTISGETDGGLTVTTKLTTHNGYVILSDYIKSKGFVADKSTMHRFANLVADTYKTTTGNNPTKINVKLGKGRYKPNTSAYEVEMIPMLDMCFRKLVNS